MEIGKEGAWESPKKSIQRQIERLMEVKRRLVFLSDSTALLAGRRQTHNHSKRLNNVAMT